MEADTLNRSHGHNGQRSIVLQPRGTEPMGRPLQLSLDESRAAKLASASNARVSAGFVRLGGARLSAPQRPAL